MTVTKQLTQTRWTVSLCHLIECQLCAPSDINCRGRDLTTGQLNTSFFSCVTALARGEALLSCCAKKGKHPGNRRESWASFPQCVFWVFPYFLHTVFRKTVAICTFTGLLHNSWCALTASECWSKFSLNWLFKTLNEIWRHYMYAKNCLQTFTEAQGSNFTGKGKLWNVKYKKMGMNT